MKVDNATISDTAWGSIDKTALGNKCAEAYAAGDMTRAQVEEVYAYAPAEAFTKDGDGNPSLLVSKLKLPHHEIRGTTIVLNRAGVHACAVAMAGGRGGGMDLPEAAMAKAMKHIRGHYADMGETPPDSMMGKGGGTPTMEYKVVRSFIKSIEGRAATGIFAVHGNIDFYGDMSHPGSFAKTIMERGPGGAGKIMHLWNHNTDMFAGPPIAKVTGLRELSRAELPEEVLAAAPTATGGVEVTREYLDTPRAQEVFAAVKAGAVTEMSYAYDPLRFDFMEIDGQQVRNLREMRLYETSDTLWGANEATLASKGLLPTLDVYLKQMERYLEAQTKSGARHSAADIALLNSMHKAIVQLGATNCKGSAGDDDEDGESDNGKDDGKDDGKSRAALEGALTKADLFLASLLR